MLTIWRKVQRERSTGGRGGRDKHCHSARPLRRMRRQFLFSDSSSTLCLHRTRGSGSGGLGKREEWGVESGVESGRGGERARERDRGGEQGSRAEIEGARECEGDREGERGNAWEIERGEGARKGERYCSRHAVAVGE